MAEERGRNYSAPTSFAPRGTQPKALARHAMVLCVFMFALGFPGKLANLFGGDRVSMLLQYALFALQIVFMFMSSADQLMDVKLVDLKKEYFSIYLMLIVVWGTSMLVTHDFSSQFIACLRYSVTAMFALWVISWYDVKHILTFTYWAQSMIVLFTLMYMLLFPGDAYETIDGARSLRGILVSKNACGAELAFGLTMQVALLRTYWDENQQPSPFFYLILVCQLMLLALTRAFGSLISGGIPILYVILSRGFKGWLRRLPIGVIYILGSVGFLLFALNMIDLAAPLLEALGKDTTLTGRIPMWEQHISNILTSHTFTGFGFGMFWENESAVAAYHAAFDRNSFAGSMTSGAHNEIIELWLDSGLIGLAAYFFMIFASFRKIRKMKEPVYLFCVTVMMGLFIKGLTERVHSTASYWTLYTFLSCGLALKSRAEQQSVPSPDIRG